MARLLQWGAPLDQEPGLEVSIALLIIIHNISLGGTLYFSSPQIWALQC